MSATIRTAVARGVSGTRVSSQRVGGLAVGARGTTRGLMTAAMPMAATSQWSALVQRGSQHNPGSAALVQSMRLLSLRQQGRGFSATAATAEEEAKTPAAKKPASKKKKAPKKKAAKTKARAAKKPAAKKKPVAKKKPAAKKKKAVKKVPKRAKKVVTAEEKKKLIVRTLKKKALLKAPKKLPDLPWLVYVVEKTKGSKTGGGPINLGAIMPGLGQSFKELPHLEIQRLQETANKNREANKSAYKAWVESHAPGDVSAANYARQRLNRIAGTSYRTIKDNRQPKRPVSAFIYFNKTRWETGQFTGRPLSEVTKEIGAEWKGLSESERQPYVDHAKAETDRYASEVKVLQAESKQSP